MRERQADESKGSNLSDSFREQRDSLFAKNMKNNIRLQSEAGLPAIGKRQGEISGPVFLFICPGPERRDGSFRSASQLNPGIDFPGFSFVSA